MSSADKKSTESKPRVKKGKPIRAQDEVVFFPSAASWNEANNCWEFRIEGAVFDPENVRMRKKLMVRLLRSIMQVTPKELDCDLFRDRIRPFISNSLKGRVIKIRVGSEEIELNKKTKRNGHFGATFSLDPYQVDLLVEEGAICNRMLKYDLVVDESDEQAVSGHAHLLLPEGQSVISDVDDTIKFSNVGNRTELLKNTFLREFEVIEGMAELYQGWDKHGVDFHFVSASPWQLINPLRELLHSYRFPNGTFNLRTFRWRDQVFKRVVSEKWVGKAKEIRRLIERFPQRTYVLIGDSVERDPELYAHLAERFQKQIVGIFIRQVPGFEMTSARLDRIYSQINGTTFSTFSTSEELPDQLNF